MKSTFVLLSAILLVMPFAFVSPAYAAKPSVVCGQILMKDTRLHSDLSCSLPSGGWALSMSNGITLDCRHHTITYTGPKTQPVGGIVFNGAGHATVKNCIVTGFALDFKDAGSNDTFISNVAMNAYYVGFGDYSPPGPGTAGTSNTYIGNTCHNDATPSIPAGLCTVV